MRTRRWGLKNKAKCAYCRSTRHLVSGFLIPISRGGTAVEGNRLVCCSPCLTLQGDRTQSEFLADLRKTHGGVSRGLLLGRRAVFAAQRAESAPYGQP